MPDGSVENVQLRSGHLVCFPLAANEKATFHAEPRRGVDFGAGPGRRISGEVAGGVVGLVLDGRGRPIAFPSRTAQRAASMLEWLTTVDAYDPKLLADYVHACAGGERA